MTSDRGHKGRLSRDERIERAVADLVERLNRDEDVDPVEVIEAHPDIAAEVLRELRCFHRSGRLMVP